MMTRELHRSGPAAGAVVFPHYGARLVAGEFSAGILRDTEIIRSYDGEITTDTGGHIHVGAPGTRRAPRRARGVRHGEGPVAITQWHPTSDDERWRAR